MCQSKAEGGMRCQAHLSGSAAAITHAAVVARVSEESARRVFSELRKEGKELNLSAPTREEVAAFVQTAQTTARFDDTIPAPVRNTIIRRWGKALREALPTAATFHAWKSALSETMRRNRSRVMAVGISGMIAFTTACSGGGGNVPAPTPTSPTSSGPSTSAPVDPTASPSASSDIGVDGFVSAGVVTLPNGSYTQITPAEDNPGFVVNDAAVDQAVKDKFTPEQIAAAQKAAVTFALEEGVDSSIADNFTPEQGAIWFEENKSSFGAESQDDAELALAKPNVGGLVSSYTQDERPGYSLLADGSPRVGAANATVTNVYLSEQGQMTFAMDVLVIRKAVVTTGDGNEIMNGQVIFAMAEENGSWKIDGWNNTWTGTKPANA